MKKLQQQLLVLTSHLWPGLARFAVLGVLSVLCLLPGRGHAASITWGVATTIAGDTDVSTAGAVVYAYSQGSAGTVNGVAFTAVNSFTSWDGGKVTISGLTGTTTSAYTGGTSTPWNNLSAAYKNILVGGAYGGTGAGTITLNNLTIGKTYLVQVWVNDSRSGATTTRTETCTSTGGNTVTLAYNSTVAVGGVGQYTIGTFVADATSQSFILTGNSSSQINTLQVRDMGVAADGAWNTTTSGLLWGTAGNWLSSTIANGSTKTANFSTLDVTADTTVNLDSARLIGGLIFGDTATGTPAGWILANNGTAANTLTLAGPTHTITVNALGTDKNATISAVVAGSVGLTKAGAGTLVLTGTNTYTGGNHLGGQRRNLGSGDRHQSQRPE